MNSPKEIAHNYVEAGVGKTKLSIAKMIVLGIFAGIFIAFAAVGSTAASATIASPSVAKFVAACIFPSGLTMVLVAGSELFTGNSLLVVPLLEKRITAAGLLKNWLFVYIGNFIGSFLIAALATYGHVFSLFSNAMASSVINTAVAKVSMSFGDALIRGILCNFLVCIAVWISFAAKTVSGKVIGLFFPIMLFIVCGFEHSVANMYYIPAGILSALNPAYLEASGADVGVLTWGAMIVRNLIPVTIGNVIGGAGVGVGYWFVYLREK